MTYQYETQQDIRKEKTTEAIYTAFLELIERKSFRDISVKAICEASRISRSTFYDHFEDKYHLLKSLLRYISDDIAKGFVYFTDVTPAALPMLTLRERYKKLFKEIFFEPENKVMRDIYQQVVAEDICRKICAKQEVAISDAPWVKATGAFYAGGILSLLELWCEDRLHLQQDEMASYIRILLGDMHEQGEKLKNLSL